MLQSRLSSSFFPYQDVNAVLLVVSIYVNGTLFSALTDTGCSRTIMYVDWCWSWKRATVDIMTIGGMSRLCCGVGVVTIFLEEGGSAKINVLVVYSKPLGV